MPRPTRARRAAFALLALAVMPPAAPLGAQDATAAPVTPILTARIRAEAWDWFGDRAGDAYAYPHLLARFGLEQQRRALGWRLEFAAPLILRGPGDATQGHGAAYVRANGGHRTVARLFAKQAFVTVGDERDGHHARVGRFEFSEGSEATPADPTLAALKRRSVIQRLIGPFNFTAGARSVDGVEYGWTGRGLTVSALAALPGVGVFDLDGWDHVRELPIGYAAVTGAAPWARGRSEWRLFAVGMRDTRGLEKPDNRPPAVRTADRGAIGVTSAGGHLLQLVPTGGGPVDLTAWGTVQRGRWGAQPHRAWAYDLEAGWQPGGVPWHPWLHAGWFESSGDGDPADGTHGTFHQVLATPRLYARFPFYNLMNLRDRSVSLTLRPTPRLALRADLRALELGAAADAWYQGSGPYGRETFGLAVRASGGAQRLGTLLDLSADYALSPHWSVSAYGSAARAGAVIGDVSAGRFGFVELEYRR